MSSLLSFRSFRSWSWVAGVAALALAGCGSGGGKTATQTASSSVTPAEGGTVALPDNSAHLDIPPGAVTSTTMITVSTTNDTAPAGITAASPILKFEPDGLVFTKPVTVTFTFTNATRPLVYWSNAAGGYDPIAGTVSGSTISAQVMHFSSGFVANAPATAGAADCGEGADCAVGATCAYGATSASPKSGGSGGTSTGGGPTTSDPGSAAPKAGALCASGGSTNPAPKSSTGTDPGTAGTPSAGADASAPAGSTSTCETDAGAAPATSDASMCCQCGGDGKLHCAGCSGSTATGMPSTRDGGGVGPSTDAGPTGSTACAAGNVCAPGQACGGGDSSGAKTCCTCGADGHFTCGATCSGQPASDGGPSATGDMCVPGGACVVGGGRCGSASDTGKCQMCDCGADGKYTCSPCEGGVTPPMTDGGAPPPADDGGGSTPPPASCDPGLACPGGYQCKTPGPAGACTMCACAADGHLACGPCPGAPSNDASAPPPSDAGSPQQIPPQSCVSGGDCPTPGLGCNNAQPPGNGCLKCACSPTMQLMCAAC